MNTPISFELAKKPTLDFYFEDGEVKVNVIVWELNRQYIKLNF